MKPAHTPGPWTFAKGKHRIEVRTTPALSYAFSLSDEANARLIASAPELLAACMSALRALEDNIQPGPMDEDAKTGLREAIAKATGGAE